MNDLQIFTFLLSVVEHGKWSRQEQAGVRVRSLEFLGEGRMRSSKFPLLKRNSIQLGGSWSNDDDCSFLGELLT